MLNQIVLMGRLTRDPELRYTQSQTPVATFRIAVDRDYTGRDGGEKQTDFIDIVAWRQSAEFVSKFFTKGSMVIVTGRLQMRDWTDRDGNKRTSAEVVADRVMFGESKRSREENGGGYQQQPQNAYGMAQGGGFGAQPFQQGAAAAGAVVADGWACPQCGTQNAGNFCMQCGTKKPEPEPAPAGWFCPQCGTQNTGNFCMQCGTKKPE